MRIANLIYKLCFVLILVFSLLLTTVATADTAGFSFTLNSAGDGYVVTGYSGSDAAVTVPDWYSGKPVTMIGSGAFQGNTTVKSVSLPSSITRIGSAAFKNCSSLSSLTTYTAAARVAGDADGNGAVDMQDAILILQHGAGDSVAIITRNADVNGDGLVNIQDALILMQREAGWNVTLK